MEYNINKGIGRNVEFNGLQAQYLYFFVGGLLAIFLLFVIFYMIGIDRWFCIGFGVLSAFSLIFGVFHLNKKYGPNGLMKLAAVKPQRWKVSFQSCPWRKGAFSPKTRT